MIAMVMLMGDLGFMNFMVMFRGRLSISNVGGTVISVVILIMVFFMFMVVVVAPMNG